MADVIHAISAPIAFGYLCGDVHSTVARASSPALFVQHETECLASPLQNGFGHTNLRCNKKPVRKREDDLIGYDAAQHHDAEANGKPPRSMLKATAGKYGEHRQSRRE